MGGAEVALEVDDPAGYSRDRGEPGRGVDGVLRVHQVVDLREGQVVVERGPRLVRVVCPDAREPRGAAGVVGLEVDHLAPGPQVRGELVLEPRLGHRRPDLGRVVVPVLHEDPGPALLAPEIADLHVEPTPVERSLLVDEVLPGHRIDTRDAVDRCAGDRSPDAAVSDLTAIPAHLDVEDHAPVPGLLGVEGGQLGEGHLGLVDVGPGGEARPGEQSGGQCRCVKGSRGRSHLAHPLSMEVSGLWEERTQERPRGAAIGPVVFFERPDRVTRWRARAAGRCCGP